MTIHALASTSRLSSASAPPGLAPARPVAAQPAAPEDRVQIEAPVQAEPAPADGMGIDWISARGAGVEAAGQWQGAPGSSRSVQEGTMPEDVGAGSATSVLSDHPLVDARIQLRTP